MKISTEIDSSALVLGSDEKAVEYIAKAGFDAWDFSMFNMCRYDWSKRAAVTTNHPLSGNNYLAFARNLKKIGNDNGIHCNQSHAPFPSDCPQIFSYLKRAIECTAEAGGEICVIHPGNNKSADENAEMYMELLPFAKECGVKIATENMFNWNGEIDRVAHASCSTPKDFCENIDKLSDDSFVACLDIGHCEIMGEDVSAVRMIKALGNRIKALHIHDNDKRHDSHQLPFSMSIDFDAVVRALKDINYDGYFTLEATEFLNRYTSENAFDGIKKLAESARKLADMYEAL